jgi:stage V sporulation protein D (sporulation-specific penicillin-binding protein)
MRRAFRTRLRIIAGVLVFIALLIVVRLYFVEVVYGHEYALRAQRQYISSSQELYDRGTVYFTRKDGTLISAATLATGFLVAIDPEELKNSSQVYQQINAIMPIDQTAFNTSAAKTTDPYEVLAHHVDEASGTKIARLNIPGVLVERERWRIYPGGIEAAQTLGFVGFGNDNNYAGREGLEKFYNPTLDRSAQGLFGNFFAQLFGNLENIVVDARSAREGDVVTSIEPFVQQRLDQDLAAVTKQYSSTESGGIIMDPKTGAIIALGSYPTFDPNTFQTGDPKYFGNPIVQSEYEFGSIMKALTMAAGLDAGVIQPDSTYNDTGCIHPNGATVCNYDLRARGVIPMKEILDQSLNVGAAYIATALGHTRMHDYFSSLGFNQKTGIDLPSEVSGNIRNLSTAQDVNYDTASFGQGIAVTPIEMMRALGTLANNGSTVKPHIATAIQLNTGLSKALDWSGSTQVFKPIATQEVSDMLKQVYINDAKLEIAKNPSLSIPNLSIAAKTGTAQVVDVSTGKYYKNIFFHSFMGYFPANNPKFIILLYTNRPQGVEYASGTLTGTFMDLSNFLINYYTIPPDGSPYANSH